MSWRGSPGWQRRRSGRCSRCGGGCGRGRSCRQLGRHGGHRRERRRCSATYLDTARDAGTHDRLPAARHPGQDETQSASQPESQSQRQKNGHSDEGRPDPTAPQRLSAGAAPIQARVVARPTNPAPKPSWPPPAPPALGANDLLRKQASPTMITYLGLFSAAHD